MKLTVIVLLGLIGVAIALHGTGAYGNAGGYGNGGYGNNGGGGHKHHKSSESSSSESEEFVRPKVCSLVCTDDAKYNAFLNGVSTPIECDDFNTDVDACYTCCEGWTLSRGLTIIEFTSTLLENKCICCQPCIDNAIADFNIAGVPPLDCSAMTITVDIVACCQNWGLLRGRTLIGISGVISGAEKVCYERRCT